ncbi:MAG: RluA family pseudouridine synthase [Oscillospiraceae bacterium]|jgi:23S rRNA pseudouridine1911/1915/1917 synthase|nr:RluA family pseudouridine synthase [Oscillospiraceae bacterium]
MILEVIGIADIRLDKYISDNTDISRSLTVQLIEKGNVTVNAVVKPKKYIVKENDIIDIELPPPTLLEVNPENIPIDIVYEDIDLLVVNKQKGMVVHPSNGHYDGGTLVNALLYHCELSSINGVIRPGIVHRIDKDTSGLLLVAKNDSSHIFLSEQISKHAVTRQYRAIVLGIVKENGTVNAPIGRHPKDRKKMAAVYNGKPAVTHYEVVKHYRNTTELKCFLETGRTHQIRVHMSYIGHSVLNDTVYSAPFQKADFQGQCLHAERISFTHPNGEYMEFQTDLPEYFKKLQEVL